MNDKNVILSSPSYLSLLHSTLETDVINDTCQNSRSFLQHTDTAMLSVEGINAMLLCDTSLNHVKEDKYNVKAIMDPINTSCKDSDKTCIQFDHDSINNTNVNQSEISLINKFLGNINGGADQLLKLFQTKFQFAFEIVKLFWKEFIIFFVRSQKNQSFVNNVCLIGLYLIGPSLLIAFHIVTTNYR